MRNIKNIFLLAITAGFLFGCSPKQESYECKLDVQTKNCTVLESNSTFTSYSEVKLKFIPRNDFYATPTYDKVKVYGVDTYDYNIRTGELSFVITRDTTVLAESESSYGRSLSYGELLYFNGSDSGTLESEYQTWLYADFKWDFSSVTDETAKQELFKNLATLGLVTTELVGETTVSQADLEERPFKTFKLRNEDFIKFFVDDEKNSYFKPLSSRGGPSDNELNLFIIHETKYMPFAFPVIDETEYKVTEIKGLKSTASALIKFDGDRRCCLRYADIDFDSFDIGNGSLIDGHLDINYSFKYREE